MGRCRSHGEIFVHSKSLVNCKRLDLGEVVTFEVGYDQKRQKHIAVNCVKAGMGALQTQTETEGDMGSASITHDPQSGKSLERRQEVLDAVIADAAANAASKLLLSMGAAVDTRQRTSKGAHASTEASTDHRKQDTKESRKHQKSSKNRSRSRSSSSTSSRSRSRSRRRRSRRKKSRS